MSDGYIKYHFHDTKNILKRVILAKMRKRREYEELQRNYEHDALDIIVDKILRLVSQSKHGRYKIRFRDIKATVISMKYTGDKRLVEVEKLQVKIKNHYFRCKLRHYPFCPWCGRKPRKVEVKDNYRTIGNEYRHRVDVIFYGSGTYFSCICGCYYHLDYGAINQECLTWYVPAKTKYPKIVELVKRRFQPFGKIGSIDYMSSEPITDP